MNEKTKPQFKTKIGVIPSHVSVDENCSVDSADIASSTDEEERWLEKKLPVEELPTEYWVILKLIKSAKIGDPTATLVALSCLKDYNLKQQINQMAIRDTGGLDLLINLLRSNALNCRVASLRILDDISTNIDIRRYLVDLSILPALAECIAEPAVDLKIVACNTIANVAKVPWTRAQIRKLRFIPILVDLLDVEAAILTKSPSKLNTEEEEEIQLVMAASNALSVILTTKCHREISRKFGLVKIMAKLLKSTNDNAIVPVMALCLQCAMESSFQLAISTEGMVTDLVRHLKSKNAIVKTKCSSVIMKSASDSGVRDLVRTLGGLKFLVNCFEDEEFAVNKSFMAATCGAIWKCSESEKSSVALTDLRVFPYLLNILRNEENSEILTNAVGALAELLKIEKNRTTFLREKGLKHLISYLTSTTPNLLENTCKALEQCGKDVESAKEMEQLNAIILIWSLLRHKNPSIQGHAALSLCTYISSSENAGVLIRSLVGGFEILVDLLKGQHTFVLGAVCALVSQTAKYSENVAILTDYGIVPLLADLINTSDDFIRENLAAAIATCAPYGDNTKEFGRLRTITPLAGYMARDSLSVQRTTAMALERLSTDHHNCFTMHQSGVCPFLLDAIGSNDTQLQESAAVCLQNIRKLALETESRYMHLVV